MTMPRIQLLEALKTVLVNAIAALPSADRFKVRHHRHRESSEDEWPCVALKFVSDDTTGVTTGTDDPGLSFAETVMELSVDLIADTLLPPEVDPGEAASSTDDPTGLATPAALIQRVLAALFTTGEPANSLFGLAWDLRHEGAGNDEDSSPDAARMVERLVIMYRVRADNPNEILTGN